MFPRSPNLCHLVFAATCLVGVSVLVVMRHMDHTGNGILRQMHTSLAYAKYFHCSANFISPGSINQILTRVRRIQ